MLNQSSPLANGFSYLHISKQVRGTEENGSVMNRTGDLLLFVVFPEWKSFHQCFVISFHAGQQTTLVPF